MSLTIGTYGQSDEAEVVDLSVRAWTPVFEKLQPAVQPYVYQAFYPRGWRTRQTADIRAFLADEGERAFVAREGGRIVGWAGIRLHDEDRMGELYIIAVDPAHQKRGVAGALMRHALAAMREAGMTIAMVETGDDPGHAPSRAAYEGMGFERWPIARYFREL